MLSYQPKTLLGNIQDDWIIKQIFQWWWNTTYKSIFLIREFFKDSQVYTFFIGT